MQRQVEPELMDDEEQARAYAEADFEDANSRFIELFAAHFPQLRPTGHVLDLGCGPGDICLRFARAYPDCVVHGLDGSEPMLRYAERFLARSPELQGRVEFLQGILPDAELPQRSYETIISNSLLHHLHDPQVMWRSVRRWAAPHAAVLVMDLMRPASPEAAHSVVERYSGNEPAVLKQDFFNSLLAAFTVEEVRAQLAIAELPFEVAAVSDRHLAVWGRAPG